MKKHLYMTFSLKKLIIYALISFLSVAFVIMLEMFYCKTSVSAESNLLPVIIVDAGHGGEDGGTSSSSGIIEKDVNLDISKKLKSFFESAGYKVIMTREDDRLIYDTTSSKQRDKKISDIHNRMKIINENSNSIFLSIHQNHYDQSKYYGTQVFYSKNDPKSKEIAEIIQLKISENLQPENNRSVKASGTEIFLLHNAKTPAVMVECGFLSNPGEAQLLIDDEYQTKISAVIFESITDYLTVGK